MLLCAAETPCVLKEGPTGLVTGSSSLLAQPAESLQQSDVLSLQLFDQTLSGALIHHCSVLDALCPEQDGEGRQLLPVRVTVLLLPVTGYSCLSA